jgi:heme/copper-type cytochrome/quinol oxidase subunit 4
MMSDWKSKAKIIVFFNVMILVVCLTILTFNTISHEDIHASIYRDYGCKNVSIDLELWGVLGGVTSCTLTEDMSEESYLSMSELQNQNEIVSYNMFNLIVSIFLATCFVVSSIIIVSKED